MTFGGELGSDSATFGADEIVAGVKNRIRDTIENSRETLAPGNDSGGLGNRGFI